MADRSPTTSTTSTIDPAAPAPASPAHHPEPEHPRPRHAVGVGTLVAAIAATLAAVIVAPIALSSGDLMAWARSPLGLDLHGWWPWVVFGALDAAAAVCVLFVIYSAWRGEAAGIFGALVWLFAGGSAVANYRHGQATPAKDDAIFFAAMSLAGPVLLHATLHRVRRWVRTSAGEYHLARAHFGLRWLPGVAFRETLQAWKAAVRAGIDGPEVAVGYVRERRLLADLTADPDAGPREAIGYAVGALSEAGVPFTAHTIRVWLAERGVVVDAATLTETLRALPASGVLAASPALNGSPPTTARAALTLPPGAERAPERERDREWRAPTRRERERPQPRHRPHARAPQDGPGQYAERYQRVKALYLEGVTVAEQIAARLGLPSSTARRLVATVKRDLANDRLGSSHAATPDDADRATPSAQHPQDPTGDGPSDGSGDGSPPPLSATPNGSAEHVIDPASGGNAADAVSVSAATGSAATGIAAGSAAGNGEAPR